MYVRFETRLGISRSLEVSTARMTLSELAMHSMHSVDHGVVHADDRNGYGLRAYHRKYRHVARQYPKKWLGQDPNARNSDQRDRISQYLQETVRSTLKTSCCAMPLSWVASD